MTGSLRQRGPDAWQLRVYQGADAGIGRQRWATTTVHGSKRHARAQLVEFARQAEEGGRRAGTVADLLDRWDDAASPKWSPNTCRETCSIVEHHLKAHLGHLAVDKLTTQDVDDFCGWLLSSGRHDGGPLAAGTVQRVHGVLHRAFAQAVRWEWVWFNPVSNASPPRVPPAAVRPPTIEAVVRLPDTVHDENPALFTYLRLAASSGARRSQLLGLRWDEVDFEHSAVGFARAYVEGDHGPVRRSTKTHRTYRVAIDASTLGALVEHWRNVVRDAAGAGVGVTTDSFVFSGDADGRRPWLPNRVTKQFSAVHRRPDWRTSDCTICGTSWRRNARAGVSRCRRCRNASVTPARRPR